MKTVPLISVLINRDAMTKLPAHVAAHELEVAKAVFGEDNVQVIDENAGSVELDPSVEGERLAQKYGPEFVHRIYGENFKGAVARAVEAIDAKPKGRALAAA